MREGDRTEKVGGERTGAGRRGIRESGRGGGGLGRQKGKIQSQDGRKNPDTAVGRECVVVWGFIPVLGLQRLWQSCKCKCYLKINEAAAKVLGVNTF